jgi:DNA uptake protein ComE-like DNA-binding protein
MKRNHLIPSLAALVVAFALPAMAGATNTATTAKSTTASKSGTTAKSTNATTNHAKSSSAKTSTTHHASSTSAKHTHKIDVNTASREQLMTLPGVDGPMADKIISERPYKNMGELESKKVVNKEEYNKIKGHITTTKPATHAEAPASQGNSGMATQNAGSSDQNPADQTTK